MNLLILSPHRDDAAFSSSIAIRHWLSTGNEVHVLNVFTRSLYAPYDEGTECTSKAENVVRISALRRREDDAFVRSMPGLTMSDLELDDAPLRLGCDVADVCDLPADPADVARPQIEAAITARLQKAPALQALLLPLALGRHVDHLTVRDAAMPFAQQLPCAFFEDLPYAMRPGAQHDLSCFREDLRRCLHLELASMLGGGHPRARTFKQHIAKLYASQIDAAMARQIADFSKQYDGAERIWANSAWLDLAASEGLSVAQLEPQLHLLSS